jgi:UPF0176 protein
MPDIIIISFYKFTPLTELEALRETFLATMHKMGIKGTIILASEGINGSFAGSAQMVEDFSQFLKSHAPFADLNLKETVDTQNPFEKAKVKLRKEIVSMGVPGVAPDTTDGSHLSPEEWHALIQDPEVILLDTRNSYEYSLGTFKNAINPAIDNFREFPDYVQTHLGDKKDKKIAMFCTGGIRCEKTTAYMKAQGFDTVYQLHDGILHYIEAIPKTESLWEGECFVFDNRVAVDKNLDRVLPQLPQDYKEKRKRI